MVGIFFFPLLILIGLVFVLPIVLICVLLGRRTQPPAVMPAQARSAVSPEARNQRREAILEKLAKKEITRDEAEQQLIELDNPLPEQMPTPPRSNSGCATGCLIAMLIGFMLIFLLLASLFFVRHKAVNTRQQQMQHMQLMQEER